MCVIVIKPKDVELDEEILAACWDANPDGAGFSYVSKKTVIIEKGFMTFRALFNRLKKFEEKEMVIHFRWATHGLRDEGNCHPFPVSYFNADLRKTKISTTVALFHNGIIRGMKYDKVLSDSQVFIRDFLTFFSDDELKTEGDVTEAMKNTGSKFVMMFADGTIKKIGKFETSDQMQFSNLNFLAYMEV